MYERCETSQICFSGEYEAAASHVRAAHLGEQLPGPGDGVLLEVVPKGPVAQHLKEGVVVRVLAHVVQVVVLP
jgi:hypothetical protein